MGILSRGYCAVENMASKQGFGAEAGIGDTPGAWNYRKVGTETEVRISL